MEKTQNQAGYRIWGADNYVYGPVELPTLIEWIKEERVTANTWVFIEHQSRWEMANKIPELKILFKDSTTDPSIQSNNISKTASISIKPQALRRIRVFADFTDDQLAKFLNYLELVEIPQFKTVVKQGESGDSMYFILEGELRVRLMVGGKETILAILQTGEFFGEISLFDKGPRSADVVANQNSKLLKLGAAAFEKLINDLPELGAPFLFYIGKTLAARIRTDDRRIHDSISFARTAGIKGAPQS
ncbi:MAG: cyclic nucleotide-binding domain-containing protein [Verrucomicrobiia bacterium]